MEKPNIRKIGKAVSDYFSRADIDKHYSDSFQTLINITQSKAGSKEDLRYLVREHMTSELLDNFLGKVIPNALSLGGLITAVMAQDPKWINLTVLGECLRAGHYLSKRSEYTPKSNAESA